MLLIFVVRNLGWQEGFETLHWLAECHPLLVPVLASVQGIALRSVALRAYVP